MSRNKKKKQLSLDGFFAEKNKLDTQNTVTLKEKIVKDKESQFKDLLEVADRKHLESEHKGDVTELVAKFLKTIKLPEISSPQMQRFRFEEIAKPNSKILVVTEKPKVALAFARALGGKNYRKTTYSRTVIYSLRYKGRFITIVPLKGHLIEYDTKKKYKSWTSTDPLEIVKNEDCLYRKLRYPNIARVLRQLAMKHDILFIATDSDEEGENIGWEAMQIVREVKNMPAYRIWFLSIQPGEIINAFNNPTKPLISWALAPEARKVIDAFSGFSSTRELTSIGKKSGGLMKLALKGNILSLGRVQSPTLYLLFVRERFIRNFKPKPYWSLCAHLRVDNTEIVAEHKGSPFYQEDRATAVYNKVRGAKQATIKTIDAKTEHKRPEPPLNTNRALIMLNKILKLPASRAMKILEELYLEGLITYPRTDTDRYPDKYNHRINLERLSRHPTLGKYAAIIISSGCKLRRNGRKLIGDHLPITPIDVPKPHSKLSDIHIKVYNLIVRRYLALFFRDAVLEKSKVLIDIRGEPFIFSLTRIADKGFYEVYPFSTPKTCYVNISAGLVLPVNSIKLTKKMTKPPSRLSEAELLANMERLGLGTKSTRSEHIQKLVSRRYVIRKGNRLHVTELGYKICEFLEKIWPEFLQPYFNAYVHSLLRKIMNEEVDYREAINLARNKFIDMFLELRRKRKDLQQVLSSITEIETKKTRKSKRKRKS